MRAGAERSLLQLVNASPRAEHPDEFEMQVASLTGADALASQFSAEPAFFDLKTGGFGALGRLLAHTRDLRPDVIQGWMYHGTSPRPGWDGDSECR